MIKRFMEFNESKITLDEYLIHISEELKDRFDVSVDEIDQILNYYMDEIEYAFYNKDGYINVKELIENTFIKDGKLKWKR